MGIYNLVALLKIITWAAIAISTRYFVNPLEDPAFAITSFSLGIGLLTRWVFFYIFYGLQRLAMPQFHSIKIATLARWQALLMMLFVIANISLLILKIWSKPLSILLLFITILIQFLLAFSIYNSSQDGR